MGADAVGNPALHRLLTRGMGKATPSSASSPRTSIGRGNPCLRAVRASPVKRQEWSYHREIRGVMSILKGPSNSMEAMDNISCSAPRNPRAVAVHWRNVGQVRETARTLRYVHLQNVTFALFNCDIWVSTLAIVRERPTYPHAAASACTRPSKAQGEGAPAIRCRARPPAPLRLTCRARSKAMGPSPSWRVDHRPRDCRKLGLSPRS